MFIIYTRENIKEIYNEIELLKNMERLSCDKCTNPSQFSDIQQLKQHLLLKHYTCKICESKKYCTYLISNYNKHVRNVHFNKKKIICNKCRKPLSLMYYKKFHKCY